MMDKAQTFQANSNKNIKQELNLKIERAPENT
jgi:hypothetical protein